jgi:hypothetical protein
LCGVAAALTNRSEQRVADEDVDDAAAAERHAEEDEPLGLGTDLTQSEVNSIAAVAYF